MTYKSAYPRLLEAWLLGEQKFPLEYPIAKLPDSFTQSQSVLANWKAHSRQFGYAVEYAKKTHQTLGLQTIPNRILIPSFDVAIGIVGCQKQFAQFSADVQLIRDLLPEIESWLPLHINRVQKYFGKWQDLCEAVRYLVENDVSQHYLRTLPLRSDSKFIETHWNIITELASYITSSAIELEGKFSKTNFRFGFSRI